MADDGRRYEDYGGLKATVDFLRSEVDKLREKGHRQANIIQAATNRIAVLEIRESSLKDRDAAMVLRIKDAEDRLDDSDAWRNRVIGGAAVVAFIFGIIGAYLGDILHRL